MIESLNNPQNRLSNKSRQSPQDVDQLSQPSSPHKILQIADLKLQVEGFLDLLESKVTTVKEKNLAEFLIAYKGYMEKMKRDLQQIKQKSDEVQQYYKSNETISKMQKELDWFREESVKLYSKVELKNKEIYELKFLIEGIKRENEFLETQVKGLMRKNKQLEVLLRTQPDQSIRKPSEPSSTNMFCTQTKTTNRIQSSTFKREDRSIIHSQHTEASSYSSKHQQKVQLIAKQNEIELPLKIINNVVQYIDYIEASYSRQLKLMKTRLQQSIGQSTKIISNKSELEEFFFNCVETIRRDIIKRRNLQNPMLDFNQLIDFNQFQKEDKLKVLECLLTNEKLLLTLYQQIFTKNTQQGNNTEPTQYLHTQPNTSEGQNYKLEQQIQTDIIDKRRSFSSKEKMIIKKGKLIYK